MGRSDDPDEARAALLDVPGLQWLVWIKSGPTRKKKWRTGGGVKGAPRLIDPGSEGPHRRGTHIHTISQMILMLWLIWCMFYNFLLK